MLNNYLNRPRKKAWIGAAISAAVGIGSSIFGAVKQKKAQEKQYALQHNTQLRDTGLTSAGNLTSAYANSNELDEEFRNRFMRMGGRRKCKDGGGFNWSMDDTLSLITGLGSAGSNVANSAITATPHTGVYPNAIKPLASDNEDNEVAYDSAARSSFLNNYYRTSALRCGGVKMKRK